MKHLSRARRPLRRAVPLTAAVAAVLALPSAASAATCAYSAPGGAPLIDGAGWLWDQQIDASFDDGTDDAFDTYGGWRVAANGSDVGYTASDGTACTSELGGRQIAFPQQDAGPLKVSVEVYVPADAAFARSLLVVRNPTAAPVTAGISFTGDLGSDSNTKVIGTSSGDAVATAADRWVASDDSLTNATYAMSEDPAVITAFGRAGAPDALDAISYVNAEQLVTATWSNVVIPANQTREILVLLAQRRTSAEALSGAPALGSEPRAFDGMTPAEKATVINWPADYDLDGKADEADNCRLVANGDQSDIDRDGKGDACDNDVDGDGLDAATEKARGTDALKTDTDGDGVADAADSCGTVAGKGANGCPRFDDSTPPKLSAKGVGKKVKLKALKKGLKVKVACNEACAIEGRLVGAVRAARIAAAGDLEIATAGLKRGTGARTLKLRPKGAAARALRKGARLRVVLVARDRAANTTTRTLKLRIA